MSQKQTILVVDEDEFSRNLYADLLREEGYVVFDLSNAKEAKSLFDRQNIDLVVSEIGKTPSDGFDLLNFINANYQQTDVIVTTSFADVDSAVKAFRNGARDYLQKPVNVSEFKLTVSRFLEQKSLFQENIEFSPYLGLFEACQRIAGCLEKDQLLSLSLHALCQELEAKDCFAISKDPEENKLRIIPLVQDNNLNLSKIEKEYLPLLNLKKISDCQEISWVNQITYPEKANKALIIPIRSNNKFQAVFFIFYDQSSKHLDPETIIQRARFISRQISLSMDNAEKFSRAREQAFVDDLSGLYNARYLKQALERELKRAERFGYSLSVLFIDLDYFKTVNDKHGHLVGSQVIMDVGKVLRSCLREIDTAVRYGGDEYTIILVNTDIKGAQKVAERIRKEIENYPFLEEEGLELKTTASIGVACYPDHAKTATELIDMADQAMYRGKRTTRNAVYIFKDVLKAG